MYWVEWATDEDIGEFWKKGRPQDNPRNQKVERVKAGIAGQGKHDLNALKRAGADPKELLDLLGRIACNDYSRLWKQRMRRRRESLRSLAVRLETLAREVEEQWAAGAAVPLRLLPVAYTYHIWMIDPKPKKNNTESLTNLRIGAMRSLAKEFRDNAANIVHFMKEYGRLDYAVGFLLVYILERTGTHHYEELARLLSDAFETAGKRDVYSADRLKKTWQRHGKKTQRLYSEFQTISGCLSRGKFSQKI